MVLMQGLGQNNIQPLSATSLTMDSGISQSVLTLHSSFSNIFRTVERLGEVQGQTDRNSEATNGYSDMANRSHWQGI